ncbi:acyltransferase family protein [Dyella sp. 2HG41-7]|uniref:acyltransferase family protein n=1 Tax=Dyella sp. 2HG41-7 TaxID=2883239 RepID=UPI001F4173D0|nr:acyltransferase family protein [Dyella sp. 2HG41-7]
MRYRKDISGLRAVAVVLVLLFHGRLAAFPSGFIGVDVFFVISGYLITSIIQSQLNKGSFSLADFYVRRLWRIQVALLAVVLATLLMAFIFYLPSDLKPYLKSAMNTVGFVSNRYFARTTTAYAATDSDVLPLLHTWSLAIEWQWYLILPLWLMVLHRVMSPAKGKVAVGVVAVLMTAVGMLIVRRSGSDAYYFFTPRVCEFLFGATVALFTLGRTPPRAGFLANVGGVVSLGVVIVVAMLGGVISNYPNGYAVLISAACAGVIWVGANERSWVARGLSWRVPEFLGEISYSLYLWHWPIFALVRYLGLRESAWLLVGCYALTVALAYASYRYIEEPYRSKRPGLPKSLLWLVLVPLLIVSAIYGVCDRLNFLPGRFGSEMARIDQTLQRYTPANRQRCMQSGGARMTDMSGCVLGDTAASQTALMIGDSYSNEGWNFIDVLARDAHVAVTAVSTPSCLSFPNISMVGWWKMTDAQYQVCVDHVKSDYQRIEAGHYRYVIIGENWRYYDPNVIVNAPSDAHSQTLGNERLERAIRQALDAITKTGATPVLLKSPALMPPDYLTCIYRHFKLRESQAANACPVSEPDDDTTRWFNGLFARLKAAYPALIVIDPKDAQCDANSCRSNIDGIPVYRDAGHITDYAAYRLGQLYLQRKPNPFESTTPAK